MQGNKAATRVVRAVIGLQALLTVAAAALWWMLKDGRAGIAALAGGGIGVASASVYAYKMAQARATQPAALMGAHYRAEIYKFAITIVLFVGVFGLYRDISPIPLFLTYILTVLAYWLALLVNP
jgi:ATP synthase protein I